MADVMHYVTFFVTAKHRLCEKFAVLRTVMHILRMLPVVQRPSATGYIFSGLVSDDLPSVVMCHLTRVAVLV